MSDISSHVPAPPPEWVRNFAKTGLTAKGVVYCLVGVLAFMAAFEINGNSTEEASREGVFRLILQQPFGKALLAIVALGLFCYTIWRFIQGFIDTEHQGHDTKGVGKRIRYIFSGLVYGSLAFLSAKMVLGSGGNSGGSSQQTLASKLLQQPFGQWLVGMVAIGITAIGIYQIYYGLSDKYRKKVRSSGLKSDIENKLIQMGKFGYLARGVVWLVIGYLFLQAALKANPQEAGGNTRAFQFLEDSSYGSFVLGAVALGLICYGIFLFMRAKFQPIGAS
ncbi:DUF1206 domain-containing protein [Pontibacter silvestris]|uniref:DUF1206 domain-containing protein n=1 Tax=Pontibacter silvestris TaxID=2305183 RepID=A0ABW4WW75_9BACT|nr:DUF1206 domain-containing protein [Pontibacter silvestris]MCC9137358.1 DUF1206 domain-containing protein [Pontibacter silvestris]